MTTVISASSNRVQVLFRLLRDVRGDRRHTIAADARLAWVASNA